MVIPIEYGTWIGTFYNDTDGNFSYGGTLVDLGKEIVPWNGEVANFVLKQVLDNGFNQVKNILSE